MPLQKFQNQGYKRMGYKDSLKMSSELNDYQRRDFGMEKSSNLHSDCSSKHRSLTMTKGEVMCPFYRGMDYTLIIAFLPTNPCLVSNHKDLGTLVKIGLKPSYVTILWSMRYFQAWQQNGMLRFKRSKNHTLVKLMEKWILEYYLSVKILS